MRFNRRRQPFRKKCYSRERTRHEQEQELELGIDGDDIGNLEDLLTLVLINGECGNPKVVVDGGELTRNITQKNFLQACRCPLCDKGYRRE